MSGGSFDYTYDKLGIYFGEMEDTELNELIPDIQKVLHDLEWWQSGDYSEEQYRKTVNKFKKKWMSEKTPEGEFVKLLKERIIESVCKWCPMNNKHCELCEISRVFMIIDLTYEERKGGAEE